MARIEMLSTACGPHYTMLRGRVYNNVPDGIAKTMTGVTTVTVKETVVVAGKEITNERVIGSVGPFARIVSPDPKRPGETFRKRDPDKIESEDE